MKPCPYCAEMIQETARKCRYCRELLPDDSDDEGWYADRIEGPPCPNCLGDDLRAGAFPWYLGTIGALVVRAVVCNRCGHQFDARKPEVDFAKRKRNLALLINGIGAVGILAIIGGLVALIMSLR